MLEITILQLVLGVAGTLASGALIGVILRHRRDLPKAEADARRTDAEAERIAAETEDIRLGSMERQIGRLDQRVKMLEAEVAECHQDRDLALAAARFLWDRLRIAAPHDDAVEKLRDYLMQPPSAIIPAGMQRNLDAID